MYVIEDEIVGVTHQIVISTTMNAHVLLLKQTRCVAISGNGWLAIWLQLLDLEIQFRGRLNEEIFTFAIEDLLLICSGVSLNQP
jgi:hypothetical protein